MRLLMAIERQEISPWIFPLISQNLEVYIARMLSSPGASSPGMASISLSGDPLGVSIIIVDIVFLALAGVATSLRLWARRITKRRLCFNDYAVIAAIVLACGLETTTILAVVSGGAGQHIIHVNPTKIISLLKGQIAANILWATANTAVKLSVLHLYITIFPTHRLRMTVYGLMGIMSAFCIAVVVQVFTICRPFNYTWNKIVEGSCHNQREISLVTSSINPFIYLMIIVLPIPMLWGIHFPLSKKFVLALMFSLGGGICAISALRIVNLKSFNDEDFIYDLARLAIWTDLEPNLGIIAACLPVVGPATKRIMDTTIYILSAFKLRIRGNTSHIPHSSRGMVNFPNVKDNAGGRSFSPLVGGSYDFTNIADGVTINHIRGPRRPESEPSSIGSDLEAQISVPVNGIDVKRYWKVDSVPVKA